jgi:hypothetical protein
MLPHPSNIESLPDWTIFLLLTTTSLKRPLAATRAAATLRAQSAAERPLQMQHGPNHPMLPHRCSLHFSFASLLPVQGALPHLLRGHLPALPSLHARRRYCRRRTSIARPKGRPKRGCDAAAAGGKLYTGTTDNDSTGGIFSSSSILLLLSLTSSAPLATTSA